MIRVLLVIDGLQFGGAENVLVTFAAYARQAGIVPRLAVLAPPNRGRDRWLPAVRAAGLDPRFLGIDRLAQPDGVSRIVAAIRASGCDIVHAHLEDSATLVPVAAAIARRPAVCTLHHVPDPGLSGREAVRERLAVRLGSRTRGLIFVSEASRQGFAARYGADPRTWTVIPNAIDLDRFTPAPTGTAHGGPRPPDAVRTAEPWPPSGDAAAVRAAEPRLPSGDAAGTVRAAEPRPPSGDAGTVPAAEPRPPSGDAAGTVRAAESRPPSGDAAGMVRAGLRLPPGVPVVTVAGHVRPGKGHDVAVEAWPRVLEDHPDARLLLVGDGPNLPGLRGRVAELGIADRVIFAGPRDDMPDVLRAGDLVLLPTRTEALPTVLIEAAGCGVPAVATRVGGVPEVVEDGTTGWLFPTPDPGQAAEAVRTALRTRATDPSGFAAVGKAARAHAEAHFDARTWTHRLATAYRTAIAGSRLGTPAEAPR